MPFRRTLVLLTAITATVLGLVFLASSTSTAPVITRHVTEHVLEPLRRQTRLAAKSAQFHLIVPATATNVNLCQLFLSAAVLGYPDPIVVGWEGKGRFDGAESHLFKISETLDYLKSLPASADDDLALVLDGYDIWFQLRPDVLISRYYDVNDAANARIREEGIFGKQRVTQSIVFGADKQCSPSDNRRAACWAVPEAPQHEKLFGPDTDISMIPARPRWLNSGTIMGPVKELRDMYNATIHLMDDQYDEDYIWRDSDQQYFADVWARQEFVRSWEKNGQVNPPSTWGEAEKANDKSLFHGVPQIPAISPENKTEYGIGLDYEGGLFQTAAAYRHFFQWMSFNHSTPVPKVNNKKLRLDQFTLPADIAASEAPLAALIGSGSGSISAASAGWENVMLGVNAVTQQAFALLHITGRKAFREDGWSRMWFVSYGEALLKYEKRRQSKDRPIAVVNGVKWMSADRNNTLFTARDGNKGGIWVERGKYVSWDKMCGAFEGPLYGREPIPSSRKKKPADEKEEAAPAEAKQHAADEGAPTNNGEGGDATDTGDDPKAKAYVEGHDMGQSDEQHKDNVHENNEVDIGDQREEDKEDQKEEQEAAKQREGESH